jgi:hypothetical protein
MWTHISCRGPGKESCAFAHHLKPEFSYSFDCSYSLIIGILVGKQDIFIFREN